MRKFIAQDYPIILFHRLVAHRHRLQAAKRWDAFEEQMDKWQTLNKFKRPVPTSSFLKEAWETKTHMNWGLCENRSKPHPSHVKVTCCPEFHNFLMSLTKDHKCTTSKYHHLYGMLHKEKSGQRKAEAVLNWLFGQCVPRGECVFHNWAWIDCSHILQQTGSILERAFVYGVLCLTRWLGEDWMPPKVGIDKWPPVDEFEKFLENNPLPP